MTYFPGGHDVLLFGGYGELGLGPWVFFQDTWAFAHNHWTEVISNTSCTPSTCPSPRADAMMTYDPPANGVLLFGGYSFSPSITYISYADTWLFSGGKWQNVTATAGTPPSPRFAASMVWDSLDNYALLFGGTAGYASYGDTWKFTGTWTNLTGSVSSPPSARDGAAISNSPSGYIMLFGGEYNGVVISDAPSGCGSSGVAKWFYAGKWVPMPLSPPCITIPPVGAPASVANITGSYPPCGRVEAALGWSPQNNRFVLFGGIGPGNESGCTGFVGFLNDSWTYQNPVGAGYYWRNATDPGYLGDPPAREQMGYASDFTDNYFEIFGGYAGVGGRNDTWRFFEHVHAQLTGPSTVDTNSSHLGFNVPFTPVGFGGSGDLQYNFSIRSLKTANTLTDSGSTDCANLTNTAGNYSLPYDGVANVDCSPTTGSYNVYRLTVNVWDLHNATEDRATANWTFTVVPPETAILYSEFKGYFYTNFSFQNNFSAYLKVAGQAAISVSATLGGQVIGFHPRSSGSFWWDSVSWNMGTLTPGAKLKLTANFGPKLPDWTLNVSYSVKMITTPGWLSSLFTFTGAVQSIPVTGAGPFNKSYAIYENYSWSVSSSSSFALPSPMLSGKYSLIPAIAVSFSASSSGNISLAGTLSLTPPKIDFGVVSLTLTVGIGLSGKFQVLNGSQGISDVQWISAKATITISGDLGANIPLYGFNVLGIQVGFTLKIDVKPSLALTLLLAPTTDTTKEIINGIQVMVQQLVGALTIALSVAVVFGIGIASVSIGGTVSIAVAFNITPTFHIGAGWLNGTVFATATFLFWTVTWNILGPAVIYSWTDPPGGLAVARGALCPTCYNNGANASWSDQSRYYVTGSYDQNVWNLNLSEGPAVSDIYPHTQVSAAPAYNGGYLFYTDDNPTAPVQQGLRVSGLHLNSSTNRLSALPAPSDPNFVLDHPEVTTLPDGSLYVVWAALPVAESTLASPLGITSLALHGARFDPSNLTWGPVATWTSGGIVQSYQLDDNGSSRTLAALVSATPLAGATTVEWLVQFDLATGREITNVSVTGLSQIISVRGGLGDAVVQNAGGNYSVLDLSTGGSVALSVTAPPNSHLISESWVARSTSTLALLFRTPNASEIVLYDLRTSRVLATLPTDQSTTTLAAIFGAGQYYVFASMHTGIQAWTESGGTFVNLTDLARPNLESFGLVQAGSAIVVYALSTDGNSPTPVVTLTLDEVGSGLPGVGGWPVPPPPPPPKTPPPATNVTSIGSVNTTLYFEYLAIAAIAVAVLLAVIAVVGRRRQKPPRSPSSEAPPTAKPPSPPEPPP